MQKKNLMLMSAILYTIFCTCFPHAVSFLPSFFVMQKRMGGSPGSQERHCQKIQREEGGGRDGAEQQILAAGGRAEGVGRQRHQAIRGQWFRLACVNFSEPWCNDDGRRELQSVAVAEQAGAAVAVQPAHQHSSLRHQPCRQRSTLRYRRKGPGHLPISVADPGSWIRWLFDAGSRIRKRFFSDPGSLNDKVLGKSTVL